MNKFEVKKFVEGYLSECGALMDCGKNCKKDDLKNCGDDKKECTKESKSPVLGSEWISDADASHVKICGTPDEHTVEFCNIDGTGKKSMDRQEFLSNFQ